MLIPWPWVPPDDLMAFSRSDTSAPHYELAAPTTPPAPAAAYCAFPVPRPPASHHPLPSRYRVPLRACKGGGVWSLACQQLSSPSLVGGDSPSAPSPWPFKGGT
ncbi:unnamed protein product [Natator depressus]